MIANIFYTGRQTTGACEKPVISPTVRGGEHILING
jgi:hypothetical protein